MDDQQQLYLDFNADNVAEAAAAAPQPELAPAQLRRAVVAWLLGLEASGIATKTPTRISRFRADVAAFWSEVKRSSRRGPSKILSPCRTVIVECRESREACWPDAGKSEQLLPQLKDLRRERLALEARIREAEPDLLLNAGLFPDAADWDYERTTNPDYKPLCRKLRRLERALYQGSRFEAIAQSNLADQLYLAVPEDLVQAHELAAGWGLLYVTEDFTVREVLAPEDHPCRETHRLHLVQNIAIAATSEVLFANGIYQPEGEDLQFLPLPRRRRPGRNP